MNLRRKTYIDPEVQGALARRLVVHWAIFIATTTALVFGMQWLSDPFTPLSEHFATVLGVYGPILLVLVCLAPIFVYDSVKLSNRFTGPMLRFKQATKALADGENPAKIRLRGGDFWRDVATDLNCVIERLDTSADGGDAKPVA